MYNQEQLAIYEEYVMPTIQNDIFTNNTDQIHDLVQKKIYTVVP